MLLHIVFYAKIASETNDFDIADVANAICDKLIHRHPHIYGNVKVKDEAEVKANWEKLKEGKKSVLEGVPKSLPALVKAIRIQDKARGIGFDWDNKDQVFEKVKEEINELQHEVDNKTERIEAEFGYLLFSLINYGKFLGINPEDALEKTNKRFINRFQHMEKGIAEDNSSLSEMNLKEMDVYWNKAKEEFL